MWNCGEKFQNGHLHKSFIELGLPFVPDWMNYYILIVLLDRVWLNQTAILF